MKKLFQVSAESIRFAHILARIAVIALLFIVPYDIKMLGVSLISYYILLGIGLSIVLHRYYSHKSFEFVHPSIKWLFTTIGLLAMRGSPLAWAYIHRQHHQYVDTELDPHTPAGRKFNPLTLNLDSSNSTDSLNIFRVRSIATNDQIKINQYYWLILICMLAPLCLYSLTWFFYAWLLPVVVIQLTFHAHNFISHWPMFGSYVNYTEKKCGQSQNNWLFWLVYLGESWHNNHHQASRSYSMSRQLWELDPAAWLIRLIGKDYK